MSESQRYNFEELREQINNELLDEKMPERLYQSTNGIMKVLDAIVKTKGKGWAAQVLNNEGHPLLSLQEQTKFTDAFQPYIESIVLFFGEQHQEQDEMTGGQYKPDVAKLSGLSSDFLKTKAEQATHTFGIKIDPTKMPGPDEIYSKIVDRIGQVNSVVNDYASKYGVLKLEKEHDLEPDIRLIPQPAALAISEGVFGLSSAAGFPILPNITLEVLSKIKVPFRTIVFTIYLALDIARISVGITGPTIARKILSIVLAIAELLRGDWKKAVLTFIGYYGMTPLLFGELIKVFVSLFRMLSPQLQQSIIFGSLDASKSLLVGLLLSIFQVTAPEEVRLPLIGQLEKIAQRKAQIDGTLEDANLSARPDYLAPTFEDLNNIQAVMSDDAYICSCEFEDLIAAVNKSAIIKIVLQILRIPVNKDFKEYKCGPGPCKKFVPLVVQQAKADKEKKEQVSKPFSVSNFQNPIDLNPASILTRKVSNTADEAKEAVTGAVNTATSTASDALSSAITSSLTTSSKEEKKEEPEAESEAKPVSSAPQPLETPTPTVTKGGRILHARVKRL